MQKTVITFGLISGLIVVVLWHGTRPLWMDDEGQMNMSTGMIIGFLNMLIALSMVFFGIRQYRERHLDGRINFGKAFTAGLLITLIASAVYVIGWMIYYHTTDIGETFHVQYLEYMKEKWSAAGMTADQIQQKTAGFEKNMEMYQKNPIVMAGMTLMEILPVGLIITLLSALILKKKRSP